MHICGAQLEKDPKLCTKALIYCEQNSVAYINRAILYEGDRKFKLAQNDYSSAIYYAPEKGQFYMSRAQFYWKNNKIPQSNADIKQYWQIKNKQNFINFRKKDKQLKCKQISKQQISLYETCLSEKTIQLQGLLGRIRTLTNQATQQQWRLQIPASPKNNITKQQEKPKIIQKEEVLIQKEEVPLKQQSVQQKKLQDSAYIDQSSKNLSQQIQKLQKQIRLQKGKLSTSQSQSQSQSQSRQQQKQPSQQFTFLTAEIQKKSKQIQVIKRLQVLSPRHSQSSVTSKISDKIITLDQIANYKKIKLQIVSGQYFDASNKQQSKVLISYGQQKSQTQYSKTNLWRQKLQLNIQHNLHKSFNSALDSSGQVESDDINDKVLKGQILVQLQMKSKSIWSSKKIIGRGTINIQQMGANKCIVSNGQQKTGIIYFKIKLQ